MILNHEKIENLYTYYQEGYDPEKPYFYKWTSFFGGSSFDSKKLHIIEGALRAEKNMKIDLVSEDVSFFTAWFKKYRPAGQVIEVRIVCYCDDKIKELKEIVEMIEKGKK